MERSGSSPDEQPTVADRSAAPAARRHRAPTEGGTIAGSEANGAMIIVLEAARVHRREFSGRTPGLVESYDEPLALDLSLGIGVSASGQCPCVGSRWDALDTCSGLSQSVAR
ncbi:MAG: hypothetical protein ACHQ9S_26700 [Candidatus Binatia bacterium]